MTEGKRQIAIDFPLDAPRPSRQGLRGYLLETLGTATIDSGSGRLIPTLARFAVFDLLAVWTGPEGGNRHDAANWSFDWIRCGQEVAVNVWEDTEGLADYPVVCERHESGLFVPYWIGCEATALDTGPLE